LKFEVLNVLYVKFDFEELSFIQYLIINEQI
jgi:hypothetical protein